MQKDLVRRWYEVMWNHWNEAVFDRILDPAIELRGSLGQAHRGFSGVAAYMRIASVFLRFALAATFADSVCDRLGTWGPPGSPHVAGGDFGHFEAYVRILNWFSPAALIPAIALTVTILETGLTIALALGLWLRWTSIAAGPSCFSSAWP